MQPRIALIGGLDPGGQAGLAADLHATFALSAQGLPIVAARTAQSDRQWRGAWPTDPHELRATLDVVAQQPVDAVKIGMIGSLANLREIVSWIRQLTKPSVIDPLLLSTSGGWMWPGEDEAAVRQALRSQLLPAAAWATPNWLELAWLVEQPPARDLDEMQAQLRMLPCGVLLKGGHAPAPWTGRDWLWDGTDLHPLAVRPAWPLAQDLDAASKTASPPQPVNPRGTGCRLATAWAVGLARGLPAQAAAEHAAGWLDEWVRLTAKV